jgi:hypothetical protein
MIYENLSLHDVKIHAKLLSKKLSLPLGHAQEIVAFRYKCDNWSQLKNCFSNDNFVFLAKRFDVMSLTDKQSVIDFLTPHIGALKKSKNISLQFKDSLLCKVVENRWSAIQASTLSSIPEEEFPFGNLSESLTFHITENLEEHINFYDDSICIYLQKDGYSNLWLNSDFYFQNIYGRNFKKENRVYFDIGEWDHTVINPASTLEKGTQEYSYAVFERPWFISAHINYLKLLSKQFLSLGVQVTFRIQHIKNANLWACYTEKKSYQHYAEGLLKMIDRLIIEGGVFVFDIDENGKKYHHGLQVSFDCAPFAKEVCK